MSEEKLKTLLARLPEKQRESARERIEESVRYGWRDISLYSEESLDERDLCGIHPASGDLDFLP